MKSSAELTSGPYGVEIINFLPTDAGALIRKEADMNAVIVQMMEAPQDDGRMEYRRVVSIMCKDSEFLPTLKAEAYRILRA